MAECASDLIARSGGGSHTSLQAEGTLLQNPQALVVWFAVGRSLKVGGIILNLHGDI